MIRVENGFAEHERAAVAQLYWQAFGEKLGKVLGPEPRALRFLDPALNPGFAIVARETGGAILGVAGFKTKAGGLVQGGLRDLAAVYGWPGALWRGALLHTLERELQPGVFQMDGICVAETARGQGVGTLLLQAIFQEAAARDMAEIHLDVIDTNPRARALYERRGFEPVREEHTGPLRHVFGFASATRMRRTMPQGAHT